MNGKNRREILAGARERVHSLAFDLSLRNLADVLSDPAERSSLEESLRSAEGELALIGSAAISQAAARALQALAGSPQSPAELEGALADLSGLLRAEPEAAASPSEPVLSGLAQDPQLLADFLLEAREHLSNIEAQLLTLEHKPDHKDSIHSAFRSFHTLKGLAGFLEFQVIQETSHEVETLLDRARNGDLAISAELIDVVLAAADSIGVWLEHLEGRIGQPEAPANLLAAIRALGQGREAEDTPAGPAAIPEAAQETAAPAQPAEPGRTAREEASAVKVDTAKLEYLVDMVGELVISESMVRHDPDLAAVRTPRLQRNLAQLARVTSEVQKTAVAMRMVPIGQLFKKMARLVRDLARKSGKLADLVTRGEDVELDRRIAEELADPLVHMLRNSLDHGLELPEERERAGKPRAGRVTLKASHQAGTIVIEVRDDGRGLSRERILKTALDRGLIQPGGELSDGEVWQLIFEPGFSTAERVTDVSGRGVGMDVVRKQVQRLRGRIEIESSLGAGTVFLLKLPLTLAIIDGLVVEVGTERYIVPIFAVREMFRPAPDMIFTVEGRAEMVLVRGKLLPLVRLYRHLGIRPRSEDPAQSLVIVGESEGRNYCLLVDSLLGKQEVVIKGLGETFRDVRGLAGGAILGDGRVGLILDMGSIGRGAPR
jgi:two-component system chemotaxis sensor kinase CheA